MDKTSGNNRIKLCQEVLFDPERKPISVIIKELCSLLWSDKEIPGHYFTNYLFKKGMPDGKNFLPIKLAAKIAPRLNDPRLKETLDNKLYFDLYYSQFNVRIPKTILYNHGKRFVTKGRAININNIHEFKTLLKDTFAIHPSLDALFVKKIYSSSKGANIYKISSGLIDSEAVDLQHIFNEILKSEFLFQETIKQHCALNTLNPSSVNTIRIDTFIDRNGQVHVLSGYLRMSLNNHYVDNIGSGGCMVGVDMDLGLLKKYGYTDFNNNPTELLTGHPKTGTVFEGYEIPLIPETKELVCRAASLMPGLRIIGWDVAIGEDGPVIIEGNSDYGIRGNDLAYGGYRAHPLFKNVLKEVT